MNTMPPSTALTFDPHRLRLDFPILHQTVHRDRRLIYFDNAASTQRPAAVIEAMDHCYRQDYANVHRGIHTLSERMTTQYEEARQKVQQWLGARSAREIIFTGGTTAAINLVAHSFGAGLQAGDEIILSIMEHHSNIVPWQQLAARQGVILRWVGLQEDGTLDLEQFLQCLGPRTKLVAITMVSNVLGLINPVESLIQWSHAAGAKVLLDAAQAAPHLPVQVQALDCDFLVFSGHKVLGPTGIGVLYGREELLEQLPPFLGGGSMIDRVEIDGFSPAELPAKFEAGTPPIVEAIGLAAAIDYLSAIGMDQIDAHERGLARQCLDGLADLPGLRILGPSSGPRVGLVSLAVEGINSQDLARFLDFRGFAARAGHHCAMPLHQSLGLSNSLRVSFYLYNTAEEVAQFTELLPQLLERLR
jgi:cysteine desulfurase/selenocysteine lyase